jgi:hypothetical protein
MHNHISKLKAKFANNNKMLKNKKKSPALLSKVKSKPSKPSPQVKPVSSEQLKTYQDTNAESYGLKTQIRDRKVSAVNTNNHDTISGNTLNLQESYSNLMKAIQTGDNLNQDTINIFNNLDQQKFQDSFINYISTSHNIDADNLSNLIAVIDEINENLDDIGFYANSSPMNILQKKIHNTLYSLISQLIKNASIDKIINKDELNSTDLSAVNSYTKYTQYKNLSNTDSVTNQCIRDSTRNFNLDITLNKEGENIWKSEPKSNKIFQDCCAKNAIKKEVSHENSAMKEWVDFCRNNVHDFVSISSLDNQEQIENAILLEATQAGSVASSQVLKNHLKQVLNLPSENYDINLTNDFTFNLDVDYIRNNIQMQSQLVCNGIEVVSFFGAEKAVVKLPPMIITGNLYFNSNSPENSYYDNFTIKKV